MNKKRRRKRRARRCGEREEARQALVLFESFLPVVLLRIMARKVVVMLSVRGNSSEDAVGIFPDIFIFVTTAFAGKI